MQCVLKIKRFIYSKAFSFLQLLEKCGKSVSQLVHFVFFTVFKYITLLVYLIQKATGFSLSHVFATVKSNLFFCLFFLVYIAIIKYNSSWFINFIRNFIMKLTFLTILIVFYKFLTTLKCSFDLDFKFNVTVDSCMNSNIYVVDFYSLA